MRISDWSSDVCSSDLSRVAHATLPRDETGHVAGRLIRGSVAPAIDDLVRDAIVTDEAPPACRLPEPKIGVGKRRGRDRKISEPGTYNDAGIRVGSEPDHCRERGDAYTFDRKRTRV